ncbi:hypothetical protein, partial [Salinibacter ruber]|uniref:hypothetical protein n=1 Tax=Salinibacter ruber TaxID=146919 RepID=UPI0039EB8A63
TARPTRPRPRDPFLKADAQVLFGTVRRVIVSTLEGDRVDTRRSVLVGVGPVRRAGNGDRPCL